MRFLSHKFSIIYLILLMVLWADVLSAQPASVSTLKKQLLSASADSIRCSLLYQLGGTYEFSCPDSCNYFYKKSLELALRLHDQRAAAQAMQRIGYVYLFYSKDETKALMWLNKAMIIAKKTNHSLVLSQIYHCLGIIASHQHVGNTYDLYMQALDYAKKANNWEVLHDSYSIVSQHLISLKKHKEAEKFALLALETCEEKDTDTWFSEGLDYYEMLMLQNRQVEARQFAQKLSSFKDKLKMTKGYFVYMNDVGKLETMLKDYDQAELRFLKILEFETKKPKIDTFHLYFIFRNLENLYLQKQEYKKAYEASKNLMDVRLWLAQKRQTQDSKLQMTQMKAASDLEKKEIKIALLETQKKQQLVLLVMAIAVAIMLISFMVFLQKNKQRVEHQKTELGQLNSTKDKLFAILSHDLRSPVASLKNYMMLINWGALSQVEFAESAQGLNLQLSNVNTMLENVLNWSVSQMGGMNPVIEKIALLPIIEEEIQLFKPVSDIKQIRVDNQTLPQSNLLADKNHLTIIIRNLLQNAIKFTNFGGNITFSYTEKAGIGKIEVKDNGLGMTKEKLENLFQFKKQISSSGTAQEQGTGLGLILVKDLVEINNGKIVVKSELEKGTIFEVSLPMA